MYRYLKGYPPLPLLLGVRLVVEELAQEQERMKWQLYLTDRPYLKEVKSFEDYKKQMIKKQPKGGDKPDRKKFHKLYGDKIKTPKGVEKCL